MSTALPSPRRETPEPLITRGASPAQRKTTRKLAEWVSLGLSIAIVGGLAGILIRDAVTGNGPYAVPNVRVMTHQIQQRGGTWIVPVLVENPASQTLRDLDIELFYARPGQEPRSDTTTIDYLGRECSESIYFYLQQDPKGLELKARAVHYRMK